MKPLKPLTGTLRDLNRELVADPFLVAKGNHDWSPIDAYTTKALMLRDTIQETLSPGSVNREWMSWIK